MKARLTQIQPLWIFMGLMLVLDLGGVFEGISPRASRVLVLGLLLVIFLASNTLALRTAHAPPKVWAMRLGFIFAVFLFFAGIYELLRVMLRVLNIPRASLLADALGLIPFVIMMAVILLWPRKRRSLPLS